MDNCHKHVIHFQTTYIMVLGNTFEKNYVI